MPLGGMAPPVHSVRMRGKRLGYGLIGAIAAVSWLYTFDTSRQQPVYFIFSVVLGSIVCLLRPLYLVIIRHPAPLSQLASDLRTHREWLLSSVFLLFALPITVEAATLIKKQIPDRIPFYLDPALADFERELLGKDAWRLTHAFFGARATAAIDLVYGLWHVVHIGLAMAIILIRPGILKLRLALAYQLTWLILGGVLATALSSVGPIFYDHFFGGDRFAKLLVGIKAAPGALMARQYLLDTLNSEALGGGISAMPSLHVGIAVLLGLSLPKRWQWAGWLFTTAIYLGSIHLGWHYALDGIVAGAGAVLFWKGAGWLLEDWPADPALRHSARPLDPQILRFASRLSDNGR